MKPWRKQKATDWDEASPGWTKRRRQWCKAASWETLSKPSSGTVPESVSAPLCDPPPWKPSGTGANSQQANRIQRSSLIPIHKHSKLKDLVGSWWLRLLTTSCVCVGVGRTCTSSKVSTGLSIVFYPGSNFPRTAPTGNKCYGRHGQCWGQRETRVNR